MFKGAKVKEVFKGLITRYQPTLNTKPETLNYKSEIIIRDIKKRFPIKKI